MYSMYSSLPLWWRTRFPSRRRHQSAEPGGRTTRPLCSRQGGKWVHLCSTTEIGSCVSASLNSSFSSSCAHSKAYELITGARRREFTCVLLIALKCSCSSPTFFFFFVLLFLTNIVDEETINPTWRTGLSGIDWIDNSHWRVTQN